MQSSAALRWESLAAAAHVWHVDPAAVSAGLLDRGRKWLTPGEQRHFERFSGESLRRDYLVTRILCRATLSQYTDADPASWFFGANSNGKPFVEAPEDFASLRFNLAHTDGLVACVVSRAGEVGVDAEETSRKIDAAEIGRHFLSSSENHQISTLSPDRQLARLFDHWVLKEAYLKGRGVGLSELPEEITIELSEDGRPQALEGWQLALHHPTPRHVAATAALPHSGGTPIPVLWRPAVFLNED